MLRNARHSKILEIIAEKEIETQEELCEELIKMNVNVTQATISRVLSVGVGSLYSGSFLIRLNAGDVIDMAISALLAVGVTLGGGVNTTLTVKQIDI